MRARTIAGMTTLPPLPAPPPIAPDWAVFLDVDGCLLDFAVAPDAVLVTDELRDVLSRLHAALGGALALVSGRPLAQLDALFAPLRLPAAGLHGLQRRDHGHGDANDDVPPALALIGQRARALAGKFPGAVIEDKGAALAFHWRGAGAGAGAGEALRQYAESVLIDLPGYRLQPGKQVIELRPDGAHKGSAIDHMMTQPPFAGRTPVLFGDDLTDEAGFVAVAAAGGHGVIVGDRRPTAAGFAVDNPAAVHAWLQGAAHVLARAPPGLAPAGPAGELRL